MVWTPTELPLLSYKVTIDPGSPGSPSSSTPLPLRSFQIEPEIETLADGLAVGKEGSTMTGESVGILDAITGLDDGDLVRVEGLADSEGEAVIDGLAVGLAGLAGLAVTGALVVSPLVTGL